MSKMKDRLRRSYYYSKRIKKLVSDKTYVLFTFDTEEDWQNNPCLYYNSYKYITSGIFYYLVDGLHNRDVTATFYAIRNLATDIPESLRYLENKNQTIGVHIHAHNFTNVKYPYKTDRTDEITSYNFAEKMKWMQVAKTQIESVLGHDVLLYRSGHLACDYETEKVAKLTGFKAISNHRGVYYIRPLDLWNLSRGREDLFNFSIFNELSKYIKHFERRARKERIIVFSAHPPLLYNHTLDEVNEKQLNTFLKFVDYLKNDENVEIINQYQLLQLVEKFSNVT